jgi:hypothetical protein
MTEEVKPSHSKMRLILLIGIVSLVVGVGVGIVGTLLAVHFTTEPPKQAEPPFRVEYPVSYLAVCEFQGHAGVTDESDNTNPYQWRCYDEEPGDVIPPNSALDIHAWCGATYEGTRAEAVDESTAYGWRCVIYL